MTKYAAFSAMKGFSVVRISEKGKYKPAPKFVSFIPRRNEKIKSCAHWTFLQRNYNLDDAYFPGRLDENDVTICDVYHATSNKQVVRELHGG